VLSARITLRDLHVGWSWAFGIFGVIALAIALRSGRAKTRIGQVFTRVVAVGIVLAEIILGPYVQDVRIE
jgi:hypothetical protein